jgi:hypothetical protein
VSLKKKAAPKAHSSIGASSMYRWSACPGSVRLSRGIKAPTSKYAAEGTCAHDLAEACLRSHIPPQHYRGNTRMADNQTFVVDDEMVEAVQMYLDAIKAECGPFDELFVEHKFALTEVHPDLFGTSDAVIWKPEPRELVTFDFKYGAGVPVDVVDNKQLKYYSLGALVTLKLPAVTVKQGIVQPRCPHPDGPVRFHTFDAIDLLDFKVDLQQFAQATEDPDAPLAAGEWCRFCPAAATCPMKFAQAQAVAAMAFEEVMAYDPKKLAYAIKLAEQLKPWIEQVHSFAYQEAEAGRVPPGYKLVDKVARRQYRDEAAAEAALKTAGLGETQMYPLPKLRSPAQIEDVLKGLKMSPAERAAILEPITEKKSSGHALVPDSDKRVAVSRQSAADAFSGA